MLLAGSMRQFIRHPSSVPVEVRIGDFVHAMHRTSNVSFGGLAIQSECELQPGVVVEVRITLVQPTFETKARVVWCRACKGGYEVGVQFLTAEDQFRGRMVEQVCRIHEYKQLIYEKEGRKLTTEEAASEWVAKYAAKFPSLVTGGSSR